MGNENAQISKSEVRIQTFRISMYILSALYLGGALFFFFIPDGVYYILNFPPLFLKVLHPLPKENVDFFWLPLVGSLMFVLSLIAYHSAKDPKNTTLVNIHIISKFVSSMGYLYLFIFSSKIFGYIIGFTLDLLICIYVFYLKIQIKNYIKET
ncbi:MAG: hypothetical protein N3G21_05430 [Candidatus Hydrogenedentes bacterium]|nr:hypothetical protein [Candidatus Hydrogenedentota bacterium]